MGTKTRWFSTAKMGVFLRSAAPEEAPAPWMLEASSWCKIQLIRWGFAREISRVFFYRCVLHVLGKRMVCWISMLKRGSRKLWDIMWLKSEKECCESHSPNGWEIPGFFRPARRAMQATKDSLHVGFSLPCGRSEVLGFWGLKVFLGILIGTITIFAELSGRPRRTQLRDPVLSSPTGPTDHSSKISKSF